MWERLTHRLFNLAHGPPLTSSSTVGIELVKRPALILLDEPLSGANSSCWMSAAGCNQLPAGGEPPPAMTCTLCTVPQQQQHLPAAIPF